MIAPRTHVCAQSTHFCAVSLHQHAIETNWQSSFQSLICCLGGPPWAIYLLNVIMTYIQVSQRTYIDKTCQLLIVMLCVMPNYNSEKVLIARCLDRSFQEHLRKSLKTSWKFSRFSVANRVGRGPHVPLLLLGRCWA